MVVLRPEQASLWLVVHDGLPPATHLATAVGTRDMPFSARMLLVVCLVESTDFVAAMQRAGTVRVGTVLVKVPVELGIGQNHAATLPCHSHVLDTVKALVEAPSTRTGGNDLEYLSLSLHTHANTRGCTLCKNSYLWTELWLVVTSALMSLHGVQRDNGITAGVFALCGPHSTQVQLVVVALNGNHFCTAAPNAVQESERTLVCDVVLDLPPEHSFENVDRVIRAGQTCVGGAFQLHTAIHKFYKRQPHTLT